MTLADFIVTVADPPREVNVRVYKSLRALRSACTQYENITASRRRRQLNAFSDTVGICHRFHSYDRDDKLSPLCAIVRLALPYIGVGVVSHELAHAVVWIRELSGVDEPLRCSNDEEFCWILGDLVRQTINTMNDRGVFDADEAAA